MPTERHPPMAVRTPPLGVKREGEVPSEREAEEVLQGHDGAWPSCYLPLITPLIGVNHKVTANTPSGADKSRKTDRACSQA